MQVWSTSDVHNIHTKRTVITEVMSLHEPHNSCISLVKSIDNAQQISWISLCKHLVVVRMSHEQTRQSVQVGTYAKYIF